METILGLFQDAEGETKRKGEVLFQEGTPGTDLYVVRVGAVAITVAGRLVERVGPGGIVGEMAIIDGAPRSATATATANSDIVPVDRKRFLFLLQQTPLFALEVMQAMAQRLRAMNRYAYND